MSPTPGTPVSLRLAEVYLFTICPAWREAAYGTDRERAALPWIEALRLIAQGKVPDEV